MFSEDMSRCAFRSEAKGALSINPAITQQNAP
jgi:hypothetical protein